MTIALDIGVHRLKSLRREHVQLIGRGCRTLHAVLPDSPARRQLLDQSRIPYAACEENLVMMGDAAAEFAALFQTRGLPLLPGGKLPHDDPPARQILASLVESLVPRARHANDICCLTLPGQAGDREAEFLTRLVRLQGYIPLVLTAGMAVVLAELVQTSFTGIGISLGAGSCEASLAHRGIEMARCALPVGGNWIDDQLAQAGGCFAWDASGAQYLETSESARWKEAHVEAVLEPTTDRGVWLHDLYSELVTELVATAAAKFGPHLAGQSASQPLHIVACGGTARIPGFAALLQQAVRSVEWPLPLGPVRVAAESDYTVARGCLINAELESELHAPAEQRAAA